MQSAVLFALAAVAVAMPHSPNQDQFMNFAWDAAAAELNMGRSGKLLAPKEVLSATAVGAGADMKVLYQESWCMTEEGLTIEDVCESMCPLYFGGKQYVFHVVVSGNGGPVTFEQLEEKENTEGQYRRRRVARRRV